MNDEKPNDAITTCPTCNQEVLSDSWSDCIALGLCSCRFGMPPLCKGDILVDRNYEVHEIVSMNKLVAENIMNILRFGKSIWRKE